MTEIADYPCTGCGCACDDITLTVEGGRVVGAANACERGQRYLLCGQEDAATATIDGRPATVDAAIGRAAELLAAAKFPLVTGLTHCTVDAQRAAVAIADAAGGCIDFGGPAERLFPDIGSVTCSLGEMMNRADVIVLWCGRPHETHPRWRERYFRGQHVIAVGDEETARANAANEFIPMAQRDGFAALWAVRAAVRGRSAGAPWARLARRLQSARCGVILFGGSGRALEAAHGLAADVNDHTRCYVVALPDAGNATGALQVLTWQTGYATGVGLHRGFPRSFGRECSAQRVIARSEADLIVAVGGTTGMAGSTPQIHIAPAQVESVDVFVPCAAFPVRTGGTIFRGDGIPLALPLASPSSRPADFQVLSRIAQRLRTMRGGG